MSIIKAKNDNRDRKAKIISAPRLIKSREADGRLWLVVVAGAAHGTAFATASAGRFAFFLILDQIDDDQRHNSRNDQ